MRSPEVGFDLRAALSAEVRGALNHLDAAAHAPRAVHRCRVHIKRARALSRVGKACAPGLAAMFHDTARGAMRALACSREAAALTEAADAHGRKASRKDRAALAQLADNLALTSTPSLPDLHAAGAALRDLLALAQVWPEASPRQIRKGAQRIAHRAARARHSGMASADAEVRHDWRKREKDRLYAAMLLGAAWPGRRRLRASQKLSDALGAERDTRILVERLEASTITTGSAKADRRALAVLEQRLKRQTKKSNALGASL